MSIIGLGVLVSACSAGSASPPPSQVEHGPVNAPAVGSPPPTVAEVPSPTPMGSPGLTPDPVGAEPFSPNELAFAPDGTLFATDCGGGRVYRLAAGQDPITVVGLGSMFQPFGGEGGPAWAAHLQCPGGSRSTGRSRMLVVDHGHGRVRRVEADGTITTIVGGGGVDVTGDTPAVQAFLSEPQSIVVDEEGNIYVSDRTNRIIRVGEHGEFTVIAGTGEAGFGGDGGPEPRHSSIRRAAWPSIGTGICTSSTRTTTASGGSIPTG